MEASPQQHPADTQPLRVQYLVSLFPCWSETFIVREIHALIRRGVDVSIISLKHPSEALVHPDAAALLDRVFYPPTALTALSRVAAEFAAQPHTQWRLLRLLARRFARSPRVLLKSLVAWWRTVALASALRPNPPDLLHAHWATYPSTAALILSETLRIPFSFTSHAHDIFVEDQLIADKLRQATFAVTISEFNRRALRERFGAEAVGRLHVVRCGIAEVPGLDSSASGDEVRVLAVGRLEEIKGLRYLVEACRILHSRALHIRCDIVGDGTQATGLRALITQQGLADSIHLHGAMRQHQVVAMLRRATVFALPCVVTKQGDKDGIPVVLMEAMASGVPVVSTFVSGIPELIEDGVSGRLVPPRDAAALAAAIEELVRDSSLRARFAERAIATVRARFNVDHEASRLLALFQEAVGPSLRQRRTL